MLFLFGNTKANDNFLYKYKITFKENPLAKITEASDWIKRFAHTDEVIISDQGLSVEFKTIYPINANIFTGKMLKVNYALSNIVLQSQSQISDEARDKIDKLEHQKQIELIK